MKLALMRMGLPTALVLGSKSLDTDKPTGVSQGHGMSARQVRWWSQIALRLFIRSVVN